MIFCTIVFLSIFPSFSLSLSLSLSLPVSHWFSLPFSVSVSFSLSINSSSSPLFYQTFTRRRPLSPEEEKRTCTDTITGIHYTLYTVHVQTLLLVYITHYTLYTCRHCFWYTVYITHCTRADTVTGIHYTLHTVHVQTLLLVYITHYTLYTCTDTVTGIHYTLYSVHVQKLLLVYIIHIIHFTKQKQGTDILLFSPLTPHRPITNEIQTTVDDKNPSLPHTRTAGNAKQRPKSLTIRQLSQQAIVTVSPVTDPNKLRDLRQTSKVACNNTVTNEYVICGCLRDMRLCVRVQGVWCCVWVFRRYEVVCGCSGGMTLCAGVQEVWGCVWVFRCDVVCGCSGGMRLSTLLLSTAL